MINTKGENILPMPESGRVLFWYGWPDDPENEDKKWLKTYFTKQTFQCSQMLSAGIRCHRKTVLGSQYCFAHLAKMVIKEIPIYKSNHKSRVIHTISKIVCVGNFYENQQVLPIYGERLTLQQHKERYQIPEACVQTNLVLLKDQNHIILFILILLIF